METFNDFVKRKKVEIEKKEEENFSEYLHFLDALSDIEEVVNSNEDTLKGLERLKEKAFNQRNNYRKKIHKYNEDPFGYAQHSINEVDFWFRSSAKELEKHNFINEFILKLKQGDDYQ
jgi:hypothetical protein